MNVRLIINEILMRIFLDHFFITTSILVLLTSTVVSYRFFKLNVPSILILSIWYSVVSIAALVFAILIIDFFSQGKGLDRLASIPLLLGVSPLLLCFFVLVFMYPKKL